MKVTVENRILRFLQKTTGQNTFTAAQGRRMFGVSNISAVINNLRNKGYAIYSNPTKKNGHTKVNTYRLGTPSAEFITRCQSRGVQVQG